MTDRYTNLCIRCGKQRMVVKTKKEYINSSLVQTTIMACPDSACQKIVDQMLRKEKMLREKIIVNQEREKKLRDRRRSRGRKKSTEDKK
ncbi:MAG: hypothetical protein UT39_C0002G0088 [Candidatus Woesebacteria bacterium GW2011_GWA1_39_21]|uniref:Uncharacterized protein n=1 Tax=Candidatus Woesebacteria bacterium GW2011_GWA1_39_21 TaxID=1618550 RepID=A0A0G0RE06_9BACT|nr:MAG: hypothetical protein UT39_C0002G0088 [Candidatus Woesebacteria bacterium GW2011_GWA1_39_21]